VDQKTTDRLSQNIVCPLPSHTEEAMLQSLLIGLKPFYDIQQAEL